MIALLKSFIARVIKKYEGGWVWDKADPGGPTNFGVTWIALAAHRGEKATSQAEWAPKVKAMTIAEATEIYERKYAAPIHFNELPAGVDCVLLDYGINSGTGRAVRVARRICGSSDGTVMTTDLVAAIKAKNPKDFINAVCDERLRFMKSLKDGAMWTRYGKGWGARVADLRSYSLSVANGTVPAAKPLDPAIDRAPKAEVPKPSTSATAGTSGGLGGLSGIAGYLADIPIWYIIGAVVAILAIGVIIGVYRDIKAKNAEEKVHI